MPFRFMILDRNSMLIVSDCGVLPFVVVGFSSPVV